GRSSAAKAATCGRIREPRGASPNLASRARSRRAAGGRVRDGTRRAPAAPRTALLRRKEIPLRLAAAGPAPPSPGPGAPLDAAERLRAARERALPPAPRRLDRAPRRRAAAPASFPLDFPDPCFLAEQQHVGG